MKFSGINSRPIPKKKEVSFDLNASLGNLTGSAEFGFSGIGGIPLRFHFESGFIYDRADPSLLGIYVGSYYAGENISISGTLSGYGSSSVYNYDINGIPVNLSGEGVGYNISKFFINTTGVNFDADFDIAIDPVDYNVSFPAFFREGNYYTGYLNNTDAESDILIFSGFVKEPTGKMDGTDFSLYSHATAEITPGNSGELVINPTGGKFNTLYDVNLVLYTNLGQINKRFIASGEIQDEYSFSLSTASFEYDFVSTEGILESGGEQIISKTGYYLTDYQTYNNQIGYSGEDFNMCLLYVEGYTGDLFTGEEGTGILSYDIEDEYNVLYGSGYLEGSGYITSGTELVGILSGTDDVEGSLTSGLGITGEADATGSFYFYATGAGISYYDAIGTGYSTLSGEGGLSGTRVLTTGSIVGSITETGIGGTTPYTGLLGEEYGERLFSGEITGLPEDAKSLDYPNSGLQNVSGHSGVLVEYVIASGIMTGELEAPVSGIGDYSGILTGYEKSFTGTWDLETGYLTGGELISMDSYRDAGKLSGIEGYAGEEIDSPYAINNFVARVTNDNMFDYEPMTVSLNISGVSSGYYEKLITGVS